MAGQNNTEHNSYIAHSLEGIKKDLGQLRAETTELRESLGDILIEHRKQAMFDRRLNIVIPFLSIGVSWMFLPAGISWYFPLSWWGALIVVFGFAALMGLGLDLGTLSVKPYIPKAGIIVFVSGFVFLSLTSRAIIQVQILIPLFITLTGSIIFVVSLYVSKWKRRHSKQ